MSVNALPPLKAYDHEIRQFFAHRPLIHIPTFFIAGQQDTFQPLAALTLSLIEKTKLSPIEWEGGHEVPISAAKRIWSRVAQEVQKVEKQSKVHSSIE